MYIYIYIYIYICIYITIKKYVIEITEEIWIKMKMNLIKLNLLIFYINESISTFCLSSCFNTMKHTANNTNHYRLN